MTTEWMPERRHNFEPGAMAPQLKWRITAKAHPGANPKTVALVDTEANARLLATARKLCIALERFLESSACSNNCSPDDMTCDTSFARAVLAEAVGKGKPVPWGNLMSWTVTARAVREAQEAKDRLAKVTEFVDKSPWIGTDEKLAVMRLAEGGKA